MRNRNRRNFGYGRRLDYAIKVALQSLYGADQQYGTVHTYHARFLHFSRWLLEYDGTRDARKITLDHVNLYAQQLNSQIEAREVKRSYAHSLLSAVNVCLGAVRGDQKIRCSPAHELGRRTYIRTSAAEGDWYQVDTGVENLIAAGNQSGAAVVRLTRALGMRLREASLADLKRISKELKETGCCRILEGCKGGRKSDSRTIDASPRVVKAVDFALSVKHTNSKNLVHPDQSLKQFFNTTIREVRSAMKESGISRIHELRAKFAQELYEAEAGQALPLTKPPECKVADERGRAAVARALGHGRSCIAKSYVGGKR